MTLQRHSDTAGLTDTLYELISYFEPSTLTKFLVPHCLNSESSARNITVSGQLDIAVAERYCNHRVAR